MESVYSQYAWLVALFPLLAFVIAISVGKSLRRMGVYVSIVASLASLVLAALIFFERIGGNVVDYTWNDFTWLSLGEYPLRFGFEITNLNALVLLIVTLVSFLVHVYSLGYMRDDDRLSVYYAYLGLFSFSMLSLVVAENMLQLYIFWELVGVSSFLLIGFWFHKPAAKAAAKKAFIVTRIGDVGLFVAILLLFWHMPNHALDFTSIQNAVHTGSVSDGILTLIAILIFVGAVGKSGQFPLHTWLPDAMEGPTPVSALIHAATMVAAGVFLVARTYDIFLASPAALAVVGYVGAFTAIFAAIIAVAQHDIKRILAYSTISQLGYMMLAMGIGTWAAYSAGIFHLFTHAFFKALLFLAAGSVIHAAHRQDIREMGGLGRTMKVTMWTFAIGALALSGIVPFSGFWSKDAILTEALSVNPVFFVLGLLAAFFTAFYMSRLFILVFTGKPRSEMPAQESPAVMTIPLVVLAVLAAVAGFVMLPQAPWLGDWLTGDLLSPHTNWLVMILSTVAGVAGIGLGWKMYAGDRATAATSGRWAGVKQVVGNRFYIDEGYQWIIVKPLYVLGHILAFFDRYIVGGLVRLATGSVLLIGRFGTRLQNGQVQTYGLLTLLGFVILVVAIAGRRIFFYE